MSQRADERDELTTLLRALPVPEPSREFRAGARRRYLEAIEARDRRAVLTGLAAAIVGLAAIASLLTITIDPVSLIAWLGETAADVSRWVAGGAVIIDLVPLSIWAAVILGSTVSVLSLVLIAQARSPTIVK